METEFDRIKGASFSRGDEALVSPVGADEIRNLPAVIDVPPVDMRFKTGLVAIVVLVSVSIVIGASMFEAREEITAPITQTAEAATPLQEEFDQAEYVKTVMAMLSDQITDVENPVLSRAEIKELAFKTAVDNGITPARLFVALVQAESDFDPNATSPKGAMSLSQLMPATAKELGLTHDQYYDPAANLDGGARHFKELLDEAGDPGLALAGYNYGLARAKKRSPSEWPAETRAYVKKVLNRSGVFSPVLAQLGDVGTVGFGGDVVGKIVSMQSGDGGQNNNTVEMTADVSDRPNVDEAILAAAQKTPDELKIRVEPGGRSSIQIEGEGDHSLKREFMLQQLKNQKIGDAS